MHQFLAKLLRAAGIVPNGQPESEYTGIQYFEALQKMFIQSVDNFNLKVVVVQSDPWDMSADPTTTIALPDGVSASKINRIDVMVRGDGGTPGYYDFKNAGDILGVPASSSKTGIYVTDLLGIVLSREDGGVFDDALFSDTGFSRARVTIEYAE